MSELNKNRLEVQKILRDCILEFFAQFNLNGWDVMEFAQASFQKADKIVLLNNVRSNRIGWQGTNFEPINSALNRKDWWIEQQHWQIHVICKRNNSENASSVLPEDLASILITWFNGRGSEYLRMHGCAPERVDSNSIIVYNDNSDLYQKRSVFTVRIEVPKEITTGEVEAEATMPNIKPV